MVTGRIHYKRWSTSFAYYFHLARLKFQRGLSNDRIIGICKPYFIITGLCWLRGNSLSTWRVAMVVSLSDALEIMFRSGVYSFCHLAEKNVPLLFELYTRCRLFNVIYSSSTFPLLPFPSYSHPVLWLLKSPIYNIYIIYCRVFQYFYWWATSGFILLFLLWLFTGL